MRQHLRASPALVLGVLLVSHVLLPVTATMLENLKSHMQVASSGKVTSVDKAIIRRQKKASKVSSWIDDIAQETQSGVDEAVKRGDAALVQIARAIGEDSEAQTNHTGNQSDGNAKLSFNATDAVTMDGPLHRRHLLNSVRSKASLMSVLIFGIVVTACLALSSAFSYVLLAPDIVGRLRQEAGKRAPGSSTVGAPKIPAFDWMPQFLSSG
eukprot:gb/GFBE01014849.1/.p1 GENE.gb/GFBE01014849.1/~~gb/GFBE01014849.1/.p1  ORF type:complete len:211 (+),score=36.08 gb/GFBE01014849.1/:1-633(+)